MEKPLVVKYRPWRRHIVEYVYEDKAQADMQISFGIGKKNIVSLLAILLKIKKKSKTVFLEKNSNTYLPLSLPMLMSLTFNCSRDLVKRKRSLSYVNVIILDN